MPLLFVATCTALLPLGATLADPLTNRSLDSVPQVRFPVLVMTGAAPRVLLLDDLRQNPSLAPESSYLVPSGKEKAVQSALNGKHLRRTEGEWILRVQRLTPERQRIELFWRQDGYVGGVYEATDTSISPLHVKMTGPGFAFIFGGIALLLNATAWLSMTFAVRSFLKRNVSG